MIDRGGNERIIGVELRSEMRQAYLDYAMSVIVSRALPDVRDGLKPVQRRILYAMYELGLRPDRPFRKSASVTGEVMGKYHPHGDAPIYDALVRLAQDFTVRYPLIQGQGNFGCFTGETKVELTNGDQKTFIELIEMVRHGLRADVFTIDQHRNVRLKPVRAPRLVRRSDDVVKVTLSNGNEVLCTPDHRFMLRDGTYREAQSLRAKDQLMPFSRSAIPERLHRTGAFPVPASLQVRVDKVEPAGRADVYDLTVDVTQNFALSAGVFVHNSIDDDPPAAQRYTEARLAAISLELLADIEKETVDWAPNYDNRLQEPLVLPSRLPNLIVNGSSGIAVGMATNIPPHNLREVTEATKRLIDDPELTIDDLCETITGPDFPGGALVYRFEEQRNVETGKAERVDALRRAYGNGRGRVIMRARAHLEDLRGGRTAIVVTELPYAVNKATLIEKIAELVQAKRLAGISDIRDESDREGMRIHIEVKRDDDPQRVLNSLYKHTAMQSAFNFNMLALVNDQPRTLSLKDILQAHIDYRRDVIRRRSEHDLAKAKERAHILEGFKIALDHIDEIVKTIRASKTPETALDGLQKKFGLSEVQAKAILDMQLRRLTGLERAKIEEEYEATIKLIAELESILASPRKVLALVKQDLDELAETYGDERRTKIVEDTVRELSDEDLVADEDVVITVSSRNYVKRMPLSTYRAQHRGGRGVIGMQTRDEDDVEHLLVARTHDRLLVFTDRGRVFALKVHELPDASRTAKGTPIQNILEAMQAGERVSALVALRDTSSAQHLVMATRKGFVKKTPIDEYANVRRAGLIAIALRKGDELAWVASCTDKDRILLATKKGKGIVFQATDARPMGRPTQGVTGIRIKKGDAVVGMGIVRPRTQVLSVTQRGFGKRTDVEEFPTQGRGGQGVILATVSDKTADIAAIEMVDEATQEVLLITTTGVVIRVPLDQIRALSRATQGVKVMATGDAAIASIATFAGAQTQTELKLKS
ncbi:MAG: DNA gyrase subunit A [Chloroflexota bacterium]|nr:DNA gyrase subunit A [Chloroflexota bacterium]MDE3193582.1 DNA gyrase subunit A [Chloroflexota bacterium]